MADQPSNKSKGELLLMIVPLAVLLIGSIPVFEKLTSGQRTYFIVMTCVAIVLYATLTVRTWLHEEERKREHRETMKKLDEQTSEIDRKLDRIRIQRDAEITALILRVSETLDSVIEGCNQKDPEIHATTRSRMELMTLHEQVPFQDQDQIDQTDKDWAKHKKVIVDAVTSKCSTLREAIKAHQPKGGNE